jgi:hypothetical protein
VLGAFGVFAVGMLLIVLGRHVIATLRAVAHSSEPITIPLAFVPFRLDGDRLGTFDRAVLIRKSPKEVSALNLSVKLSDSTGRARLAGCGLLARFNRAPAGDSTVVSDADFACVRPDSAVPPGAQPFGRVAFTPGDLSLPLFVPAEVARHFHHGMIDIQVDASGDSAAAAAERMADSITEAASNAADSMAALHEQRADSLRDMALRNADSIREAALRQADSMRRAAERLRDSIRASVHRR